MMRLDTSGYSCPEPVIMTKKALKGAGDCLEVLVDNVASRENVTRFLEASGFSVTVKDEGGKWILSASRQC